MEFKLTGEASANRVAVLFSAGARQSRDTRPVMTRIVTDMRLVEEKIFSSQGRRGGGSWSKLKDSTVRKKGTSEILRTRGANQGYSKFPADSLFKSLTEPHAPYNVQTVTRNRILFGTSHPYAEIIGASRPFMRFSDRDVDRWNAMIGEYLMAPFMEKK